MHHVFNLIVQECGVMRRFLPDGAVGQPVRIALDEVKHKHSFPKPYVLVADFSGPVAPSLPASKRAAHQPGIAPGINALHTHIVAAHRKVIVHQEIRRCRVAHLRQALSIAARWLCEALAGQFHWRDPFPSPPFHGLRSRPAKPLAARSFLLFWRVQAARPKSDVSKPEYPRCE